MLNNLKSQVTLTDQLSMNNWMSLPSHVLVCVCVCLFYPYIQNQTFVPNIMCYKRNLLSLLNNNMLPKGYPVPLLFHTIFHIIPLWACVSQRNLDTPAQQSWTSTYTYYNCALRREMSGRSHSTHCRCRCPILYLSLFCLHTKKTFSKLSSGFLHPLLIPSRTSLWTASLVFLSQ